MTHFSDGRRAEFMIEQLFVRVTLLAVSCGLPQAAQAPHPDIVSGCA